MSSLHYEFNIVVGRGRELVEASGRKVGTSYRPRLVIVPKYLTFILKIGGGAFSLAGMVFVSQKLSTAPVAVRRFILAHEAAHALFGHCSRMLAYWAAIFISAIVARGLVPGDHGRLAESLILGTGIALAQWAQPLNWELDADSVAASVVGSEVGRSTLESMFGWLNVRVGSIARKRLKALDR